MIGEGTHANDFVVVLSVVYGRFGIFISGGVMRLSKNMKRNIISFMIYLSKNNLAGGGIGRLGLLIALALFVVVGRGNTCKQITFQNASGRQCEIHNSFECNNMSIIQFNFCLYDACSDESVACSVKIRAVSYDYTNCSSTCNFNMESSSGRDWLAVTVIVFAVLVTIVTCGCIARRCCERDPPDRNQFILNMRPPSVEIQQIDSDRRLSSWNYLDFELKWVNTEPNLQWIAEEETCVICLEKQLTCCLPCRHYFHKPCIKEWLILKANCPTCKAERFDQITLRCKGCKAKQMVCFVEQLKKMDIEEKCQSCT